MKLLKDIPTKDFCSIDIETVRIKETFSELTEDYQSAWEYKNKHEGKVLNQDELAALWERTSSFYAEFSKVCAVSLAFLNKEENNLIVKGFSNVDEKVLLEDLNSFLERIYNKGNYRLIAHAGKYFDYPYLCKRYVINDLDIPRILDTGHLKPWENKNLCTNQDIWKMGGTGAGSSLQALCTALNIPISKVDLVGDEVGTAYFNGELERISKYCSYDTIATFNIIRKIKKESIFQFEEVEYLNEKESVSVTPVLERIYTSKEISDKDKEDLRKLVLVKKPNDEELEVIRDMVLNLYIQSKMFEADSKAVVKEKTNEVNELIEEICKKK